MGVWLLKYIEIKPGQDSAVRTLLIPSHNNIPCLLISVPKPTKITTLVMNETTPGGVLGQAGTGQEWLGPTRLCRGMEAPESPQHLLVLVAATESEGKGVRASKAS